MSLSIIVPDLKFLATTIARKYNLYDLAVLRHRDGNLWNEEEELWHVKTDQGMICVRGLSFAQNALWQSLNSR